MDERVSSDSRPAPSPTPVDWEALASKVKYSLLVGLYGGDQNLYDRASRTWSLLEPVLAERRARAAFHKPWRLDPGTEQALTAAVLELAAAVRELEPETTNRVIELAAQLQGGPHGQS